MWPPRRMRWGQGSECHEDTAPPQWEFKDGNKASQGDMVSGESQSSGFLTWKPQVKGQLLLPGPTWGFRCFHNLECRLGSGTDLNAKWTAHFSMCSLTCGHCGTLPLRAWPHTSPLALPLSSIPSLYCRLASLFFVGPALLLDFGTQRFLAL
jgi:hypothetical protein